MRNTRSQSKKYWQKVNYKEGAWVEGGWRWDSRYNKSKRIVSALCRSSFTSFRKNTIIRSNCISILRSKSPVEASGVFWISLFGFDNCWKYFLVRPKSNKPSCHRFNRTFWQILFKWKLDLSKEQTSCTPFVSCFQKDWTSFCPKSWEILCALKLARKLLLATNLGGGKLVLLASSEMELDFLNSPTLRALTFLL